MADEAIAVRGGSLTQRRGSAERMKTKGSFLSVSASLRERVGLMNDKTCELIEGQLAVVHPKAAPPALRAAVLADVERELREARWDRRLGRAAVVLLLLGLGLNFSAGWQLGGSVKERHANVARSEVRPSLVDTAIIVAEATDAETARHYARQLAAMSGREITADEAAAIDAAVAQPAIHRADGKRG